MRTRTPTPSTSREGVGAPGQAVGGSAWGAASDASQERRRFAALGVHSRVPGAQEPPPRPGRMRLPSPSWEGTAISVDTLRFFVLWTRFMARVWGVRIRAEPFCQKGRCGGPGTGRTPGLGQGHGTGQDPTGKGQSPGDSVTGLCFHLRSPAQPPVKREGEGRQGAVGQGEFEREGPVLDRRDAGKAPGKATWATNRGCRGHHSERVAT